MSCAEYRPRRPFDNELLHGYMESDVDYVLNNVELAVELLDRHGKKAPERPEEPRCCPYCGSDDIRFVPGIQARNMAESLNLDLDEYQCDSCRESFWV